MSRPALDDGRLIKPESLREARLRLQRVAQDIARIEAQLADPARRERLGGAAYDAWRGGAESALARFTSERERLGAWIATVDDPLLRAARDLLRALREDDVEFEPEELATIAKLDRLFEE